MSNKYKVNYNNSLREASIDLTRFLVSTIALAHYHIHGERLYSSIFMSHISYMYSSTLDLRKSKYGLLYLELLGPTQN